MAAPPAVERRGFRVLGYHDLDGRPAFKLATQKIDGRRYLYAGHFWHRGWSVLDVTDPAEARLLTFVEGPTDTWTLQVQVAGGLMVTALERPGAGWGIPPGRSHAEGALVWDVTTDPAKPALRGRYHTGGRGTHRNLWDGNLAVMTANVEGFVGNLPVFVDLSDPRTPREISRWWWPGQHQAAGEVPLHQRYLHGPASVKDTRAYLPYGRVGLVVLDISDIRKPELVTRVSFGDLGGPVGTHSAVPLGDRGLILVNSEAHAEGDGDPLNYAVVVEERGDSYRIVSTLPMPRPSDGLPYTSYYDKGGRFGPHNQHHFHGHPAHLSLSQVVLLTYFNAGLRAFDLTDPRMPVEAGFFVPEDPAERRGPKPSTLVTQSEDVLVDDRGVIFLTDKNHGLFMLEAEDPVRLQTNAIRGPIRDTLTP
jgi:hypothetical protein